MTSNRRSQGERTAATRDALVHAARPLFAQRGFADVGTEEIVRAAGVTRGALYHQFADKTELFAAVFELVEGEVTAQLQQVVAASGLADPVELMKASARAWLDACAVPEVQRIVLLDAPAVLGWQRWREICLHYALGMVVALVEGAIAAGRFVPGPVRPLAHVLIGAADEAALYLARADDPSVARAELNEVLDRVVDALAG